EEHDRREHDGTDHQRPQELVLLGLDLERLPHLAALLLARLPLGGPCRLLVRLAALALRHAPQDTWHLWRARTAATAPGGAGPPTPGESGPTARQDARRLLCGGALRGQVLEIGRHVLPPVAEGLHEELARAVRGADQRP